ncbi:hypothetical protein [Deinococcus geothermalis]|uniref:2'-5' phosphodiesterase of 2H superfamily n=1 Tax=Deinococcus geothermalis (strain DSM 11300 / CIP 105573 / AG-3a) TaxID=319795 RepID=Q1IW80_DEIGD|nr:hypothetical protein [Deinococcus geothermalis]ABF46504.1 2'-5' phosphodiesterase of 2H superfamily [Deinococcus geothermalis DSM 11300]
MTDPRQGTRFGVYLCPPAGDPYYALGSKLLGFDVRAGRAVALPDFLRPEWQADAGPYGLHLTVVEGFYTNPAWWPEIEAEVRACLACLLPDTVLTLTAGRVEAWDNGETWVHRLNANEPLLVLHTLLLARLARFVTASPFEAPVVAGKYAQPFEQARLRLLHTPRGLDSWKPHFTLVQPYGGADPEGLRACLTALTSPHHVQTYRSVALFEKREGEVRWRVRADFSLAPPQTA